MVEGNREAWRSENSKNFTSRTEIYSKKQHFMYFVTPARMPMARVRT